MSKSLVEIAAEIVTAQASYTVLSADDIADSLRQIAQTLKALQPTENGLEGDEVLPKDPHTSIQNNQVVCLECGKLFTLLSNRHLALHGLTPRAYKLKHGIRLTQALSARTLSARRRKLAKESGMGKQLAVWRADRKQRGRSEPRLAVHS
jgi:predicted transcriptional regulator